MGVTFGLVITIFSVFGIIGCLIALAVTGPKFKKQRERMLEKSVERLERR